MSNENVNTDSWTFNVGEGRHMRKVLIHLEQSIEPPKTEIVNDLLKYICVFEDIKKYALDKTE